MKIKLAFFAYPSCENFNLNLRRKAKGEKRKSYKFYQ